MNDPARATPPHDWVSMSDIAQTYGVSYETVRKWVRTGRLPSVRLGRVVRVDAAVVAERLAVAGKV